MNFSYCAPVPRFHSAIGEDFLEKRKISVRETAVAADVPKLVLCMYFEKIGGEIGIRTRGTGLIQYGCLANNWFQPLTHLSAHRTTVQKCRDGALLQLNRNEY
jgi:hypothetical protein